MNFGGRGKELLQELKRSEWLPNYNEKTVKDILKEIDLYWQELCATFDNGNRGNNEIPDAAKVGIVVHHQALMRNKRILLAYHMYRLEKLKALRWETGPVVPEHLQGALSGSEREFFSRYDSLVSGYCEGVGIDLTQDQQPPKELFIEVRALEDCGEIMTEQGTINLEKGSTHLLRRCDAENLIKQGMLEQISDDH
uniref:GINS subunit domain-containing protein n=1 Tax=Fibrocapsa japonica TaxID=94617 RepID=A0A7S2XZV1_9STRA|mmetsp:Transcript_16840/g.24710  ORF Transcript_16840/g.24710 Transcript_16840/m.24710 type:complete len:196 (+) Transcript_16840:95-682(+)|eukprot:CAMPEP_0113944908 /NCGR_PEP_ID=MMETSP1339-20121228/37749_1 /TAXON_ID=94617 /ORGANISM="Fibrocapsa japonica" /LENGTH=195 /DNA_ID=CAMNT_0000950269 /DNA_START=19 /DNA_END=606 /DNA_ORIENTATION=+ /assembly_acc=CAM_ASM_000762